MEPQDGGHRDTHKVQPLSKANVARIQVDKQEHLSFILDYVRQQSDLVKPRPPDRPATIPSLELEAACPTAGKSKKVHAMKGKDGSILSSVSKTRKGRKATKSSSSPYSSRISPLRPSNLRAKKQLQVEQMERLEQETMESAHLEHVEEPIPIHELPPEDVEIAQPQPVPASPRREPLALVPAEERNKAKRLSKGLERGKPSSTVIDDPLESSVNQKPSKNKITGKIPQKLERKFGSETTSNISSENDAFKVLKKSTKKTIKETKAARGEKVGKADRKKGNALATKVMETFHSDQVTRGRLTRKANDSQRRLGMFNKGVRSEKVHLGRVGNLAFDEAEFLADHPTRLAHAPRKPAVETGVMISDYFQQQPAALAKRPKETSNAQKRTMTEVDAGTSFVSHAEDPDPPSPVEIDCGLESGVGVANTTPSPPKRRPAQAYKVEVVIESDPRKKKLAEKYFSPGHRSDHLRSDSQKIDSVAVPRSAGEGQGKRKEGFGETDVVILFDDSSKEHSINVRKSKRPMSSNHILDSMPQASKRKTSRKAASDLVSGLFKPSRRRSDRKPSGANTYPGGHTDHDMVDPHGPHRHSGHVNMFLDAHIVSTADGIGHSGGYDEHIHGISDSVGVTSLLNSYDEQEFLPAYHTDAVMYDDETAYPMGSNVTSVVGMKDSQVGTEWDGGDPLYDNHQNPGNGPWFDDHAYDLHRADAYNPYMDPGSGSEYFVDSAYHPEDQLDMIEEEGDEHLHLEQQGMSLYFAPEDTYFSASLEQERGVSEMGGVGDRAIQGAGSNKAGRTFAYRKHRLH